MVPNTIRHPQTIGDHLRKRRLELKIKQSELAEIFNVSKDTIRFWELNQCIPSKKRMSQINEFIEINSFPKY